MGSDIVAKVVALKAHTAFGQSYEVGETYELDEAAVGNVLAQGMVRRADAVPVKAAKAVKKAAAAKTPKPAKKPARPAKKPAKPTTRGRR